MTSNDDASATQASGLFRVWPRTIEVQTVTWSVPFPLTEYAQAAQSRWDPAQDATLRCEPPRMPRAMTKNPWAIQFVDQGDSIELRLEEFDQVRTIYMGEPAIIENPQRSRLGYSTGRWEDDTTLVVRTIAIDSPYFEREGIPLSEAAEVVERFSLSEDQARLNYEVTVTDPEIFTEPASGTKYWDWKPGIELLPYEGVCE